MVSKELVGHNDTIGRLRGFKDRTKVLNRKKLESKCNFAKSCKKKSAMADQGTENTFDHQIWWQNTLGTRLRGIRARPKSTIGRVVDENGQISIESGWNFEPL